MKKVMLLFLILLVTTVSLANLYAVTTEGRVVLLRSNGTWKYEAIQLGTETVMQNDKPMLVEHGVITLKEIARIDQEYIVLELLVQNNSSEPKWFSGGLLYLRDNQGYTYSNTFLFNPPTKYNRTFEADHIAPNGGISRGAVFFQIPKSTTLVELIYDIYPALIFDISKVAEGI